MLKKKQRISQKTLQKISRGRFRIYSWPMYCLTESSLILLYVLIKIAPINVICNRESVDINTNDGCIL
jgi:hypothetical protein